MLDQMMTIAAMQSTKNYQLLEPLSHNVGNMNTTAYKSERFDMYMRPDGNTDLIRRVDHTPGDLFLTKRELDLGIKGHGYIQVTRPDGTTAYTRNGSFSKDAEGFLVTPHGDLVGAGIQLPANYHSMQITADGQVQILKEKGQQFETIGEISLVNFPNPEGLKNIGTNLYTESDASGIPVKEVEHTKFRQGMLEHANVDVHYTISDILRLNAGVLSNLRVVKVIDEIYREAINLRQ